MDVKQFHEIFLGDNPEGIMFIDPERFRYNYMVEFIQLNNNHYMNIVEDEERQFTIQQ
jgi:hypothetical protein